MESIRKSPYQFYLDHTARTPTTEAEIILTNLEDAYKRLVQVRNGNKKTPKEQHLEDLPLHETSMFSHAMTLDGDSLVQEHKINYPPDENGVFYLDEFHAIFISLTFCVQAMRADQNGEKDLAWTYVIDSRTWFTMSLSLKKMRIDVIEKRKKTSAARAKVAKERYKKHDDFILDEYKKGRWDLKLQASGVITAKLTAYIKENKLPRLSNDNMAGYVYKKLTKIKK